MENVPDKSGVNLAVKRENEGQHLAEMDVFDDTANEEESRGCVDYCKKTGHRFRTDINYQDKVVYSACIYGTLFIIGWFKGQFGPAYLDLRMISGADLEQGSWILTSLFIGYSFGSVLQGFLYERVNQKLMYSACLFIWSIIVASIPWCSFFEAMLCSYTIIGLLFGILDTGGNTEIFRLWKKKGRVAILRMNLIFALGSVVAPLVVAPFLMDPPNDIHLLNFTRNVSYLSEPELNISHAYLSKQTLYSVQNNRVGDLHSLPSTIIMRSSNNSLLPNNAKADNLSEYRFLESSFESKIYIPFSLCAGLSFIASVLFLTSYIFYSKEKIPKMLKGSTPQGARQIPTPFIICTLSLIAVLISLYTGLEGAYTAFLSTFCVEQFHWSKQDGAFLTSLVFIFVLVARVFTVIFERWIDTLVLIGINFVLLFFSILGLLIVSLYNFNTAVWFFSALFGFSQSSLFALLFSWSNEYITPITGKMSACYFVASTLGCALNPLFLGVLMENDPLWYCYLFLIEIVIILLLYIFGFVITKYIIRKYGKTYDTKPDIAKMRYAEEDRFIS